MEIIIGSQNPAKPAALAPLFEGTGCTLAPAPFSIEVEETGSDVIENALFKARAYSSALGRTVVAEDTALYFPQLAMDDPRQPGLTVRRVGGRELSDAEMIGHYTALARELGGQVEAVWVHGYALCFEDGESATFLPPLNQGYFFSLVDHLIAPLQPGFPLDSLSVVPEDWDSAPRLHLRRSTAAAIQAFFSREIEKYRERSGSF